MYRYMCVCMCVCVCVCVCACVCACAYGCARHILSPTENWSGSTPLPGCEDIAASFQEAVCRHLLTRTHRALCYVRKHIPDVKHLVSTFQDVRLFVNTF